MPSIPNRVSPGGTALLWGPATQYQTDVLLVISAASI